MGRKREGDEKVSNKNVLHKIKENLDIFVGEKIRLKTNKGRKQVIEEEGILEGTYPHIFVVKLDEQTHLPRRVTYSYADVLTEMVEITIKETTGDKRIGLLDGKGKQKKLVGI